MLKIGTKLIFYHGQEEIINIRLGEGQVITNKGIYSKKALETWIKDGKVKILESTRLTNS